MKWLGGGEGDAIIKVEMDRGPHRTQDDAAVGYVFQRPPDPEFPQFGPKQLRWAHGDDSIIDNHMDKWKYPVVSNKVATPPNSMSYMGQNTTIPAGLYDMGQNKSIPQHPEQLVYMSNQMLPSGLAMHHPQQYLQPQPQTLNQQLGQQQQMRQHQHQIAPAAKKLWGLESKDASSKLVLNHLNHDGVWRDPTWAAPEVLMPLSSSRELRTITASTKSFFVSSHEYK